MKQTVQKENFLDKDPRPTWTPESKSSLQQAKVASVPLKSILKNTIPSTHMPPPAKLPSDSPLTSPAYFMSPAETLVESTGPNADDISFHDSIEAYSTFSDRIRSQIRVVLDVAAPHPALVSLKEHSHPLAEAFLRDLKRTREEPASNMRRNTSFADNSFQTAAELDEELRISRDSAALNHQVLRSLSDIFCFPPLYSIFSTNDLRTLLSELLILGSAQSIPSPASQRTWTLVVWILSVQNLPSAVLSPVRREVVSVLKRALEGQIGKDQAKLDGLKASIQLLKQHPSLFISPLLEIFPCVLQNLIADSPAIRLQAVNALGRFALAKLSTLLAANSCASLSTTLTTFINSQTTKLKSVQHQLRLRSLVSAAISADNHSHSHPADGPFWVVQLLASFVILLDDSFFSNPRALKLTLQSLQQLARRKDKLLSALHPYVWNCLIWVFSRLPVASDGEDTRESAFLTLKQDLRCGIGLAFIFSLLGTAPDESCDSSDAVSKALMVVRDLLCSEDQLLQVDGIALLTKLLYTPSPSTVSASPRNLVVPQLFDGSLVQSKRENVISRVRSLDQLTVDQVRQLSDAEIIRDWDILSDLWARATRISLRPEFGKFKLHPSHSSVAEYRQNLLHGWQSLLLMPTDLTQGLGQHLTSPEPFASKFATLICSFIVPTDTDAEVQQLRLVNKMWHTMMNVFQPNWLSSPAETVLATVLKQSYRLSEAPIRDVWVELCSKLMAFALPIAVKAVMKRGEAQMSSEVQRQLWTLAVKSIHKSDDPVPWKDLVYLLSVPFGTWTMTEAEVDNWERLMRTAISSASSESIQPTTVVEHFFGLSGHHRFFKSPHELLTLLSYVDLAGEDVLPLGVVRAMENALHDLYPDGALASTSLEFIRRVRDIIVSAPSALALPLLLALQDSICKWLLDDENLLIGDVRTEVAQSLFSAPLSTLSDIEPSAQNLVSISPFLDTLADADAFERFWRVSYDGRDEFYEFYPENIKTSLRALGDIFGGSLAADLDSSQATARDRSPSPQASRVGPFSSFDHDGDESRRPFGADTIGMGDTRFMDVDENNATVRGKLRPPSPSLPQGVSQRQLRPVPSNALEQLQEYSSRVDESSLGISQGSRKNATGGSPHSSTTIHRNFRQAPSQATRRGGSNYLVPSQPRSAKRRAAAEATSISKRRKTSPEPTVEPTRANAIAGPSRHTGQSISEPTSRKDSAILSEHASSQPIPSRKRNGERKLILDYVHVPTYEESRRRLQESSLPTPSPSLRPPPARQPPPPSPGEEEEDYASWEAGMSIEEVKHVQHTFGRGTEYPSSPDEDLSMDIGDLGRNLAPSPSLGVSGPRSSTAPIPPREHHPVPLRRNKTSARLDALERAYAAVADDVSQPPVQDLIQATRWVHKIGAALNEQMSRKLDKPR
ncbi:hypothetical protein DFH07DRAFT_1055347 [Mycena maculata]|uniref:Telomere-associated protein Rif1 N-terminal domain-containing protein n=1 Tax=Mycena maculata TaxID=230809 RepID=A0AAD7KEX3_9AGAR|nr:hypothetical protein DFH07DRAFT_1055347 [Mycena maculata]